MKVLRSAQDNNLQVNTKLHEPACFGETSVLSDPRVGAQANDANCSVHTIESQPALLIVARATAKKLLKHRVFADRQEKAGVVLSLLNSTPQIEEVSDFKAAILRLPKDEQHYWIGTLYTLLLPAAVRRKQATYFTPPFIADAVLELVTQAGFKVGEHRVLDPAAGGAAFLSTLAGRGLRAGVAPSEIIRRIKGIELDSGLAQISAALIADRLGVRSPANVIRVQDALTVPARSSYDLVVANPPYGRITANDLPDDGWKRVAHSGHINKYAVFTELCLRHAKVGGIVALVLPSSFRAGPFYDRIRSFVRSQGEVLAIASVPERQGVFADVAQDISVLILRKGAAHSQKALVSFPVLTPERAETEKIMRTLPEASGDPWPLPVEGDSYVGGAVLADYGATIRAGYFVWNREADRLVTRSRKRTFPLVWAKNVKAGELCRPAGKTGAKMDFVRFDTESSAIVRKPAAVIQRTTNDKQPRRLIAAAVDPDIVTKWGGFVTENHTIVLTCKRASDIPLVVSLLNTKAVDDRYRRVSGTASISVKLLREIDLPRPEIFRAELKRHGGDAEAAAQKAYTLSRPNKGPDDG